MKVTELQGFSLRNQIASKTNFLQQGLRRKIYIKFSIPNFLFSTSNLDLLAATLVFAIFMSSLHFILTQLFVFQKAASFSIPRNIYNTVLELSLYKINLCHILTNSINYPYSRASHKYIQKRVLSKLIIKLRKQPNAARFT